MKIEEILPIEPIRKHYRGELEVINISLEESLKDDEADLLTASAGIANSWMAYSQHLVFHSPSPLFLRHG